MRCKQVQDLAVPTVDIPKRGVADANGVLQHGSKNRLKIARGSANDLEHFRRSRLLFQRLAEISGALTQFVEQPRVLDGDNCLIREILEEIDLFFGKGAYLHAKNYHRAKERALGYESRPA